MSTTEQLCILACVAWLAYAVGVKKAADAKAAATQQTLTTPTDWLSTWQLQ